EVCRGDDGFAAARPLADAPSAATVAFLDWAPGPVPPQANELLALRAAARNSGTVTLRLTGGVPDARTMAVLGTVVGPGLRSADHEVPILVADATTWLDERANLHI